MYIQHSSDERRRTFAKDSLSFTQIDEYSKQSTKAKEIVE